MNPQERIHRLETLLERVRTRARQPRVKRDADVAEQQAKAKMVPAITAPAVESAVNDQTQPFERSALGEIQAKQPKPVEQNAPQKPDDGELDIEIDVEPVDLGDDVGHGGLEIVQDDETTSAGASTQDATARPEPDVSKKPEEPQVGGFELEQEAKTKPLRELEFDLSTTDGTSAKNQSKQTEIKSTHQPAEAAAKLDLDTSETPINKVEPTSDALLGATVELEDKGGAQGPVEIDATPPNPPAVRPSQEMEAVLPPSVAPGAYTPGMAPDMEAKPKTPAPPKAEPTEKKAKPAQSPQVVKLEVPPAPKPIEPERSASEVHPVTLEVAGRVVTSNEVNAENIVAFVGSLEQARQDTFVAWLDESLSLRVDQ